MQAAPVQVGDSDQSAVGDPVIAIGNPFGLDRTVTTGIVSGLQRAINAPNGFTIQDVVQTDAAINPGNSGGPLLDAERRGHRRSTRRSPPRRPASVGIGFAVPINTAQRAADQIIEDGTAEHAFIGISGGDLTPEIADVLNLDISEGALVQDVTPDSPADDAGLRAGDATMSVGGAEVRVGGDVITGIDGEQVRSMEDVIAAVNGKQPGDQIELEIQRDGAGKTITLELANRPDQARG